MTGGAMVCPLERQKLMNRPERRRALCTDLEFCATRAFEWRIGYLARQTRHFYSTGHCLGMNEEGRLEIAILKLFSNLSHMRPDCLDIGSISYRWLFKNYTATIWQRFKNVAGGVLIHPHNSCATQLHGPKGGVVRGASSGGYSRQSVWRSAGVIGR
jgi:hypothetical protein